MLNNEIKMPTSYTVIDEEEMVYLDGGAETSAWQVFLNFGTLFNYIARVFSAGSSIINNVNTVVSTIKTLNNFKLFS